MMLVDLHEDIAHYFLTSLNPPPFHEDAEGRQSDLPKLRRAGADVVVAAVFPFVHVYDRWAAASQVALEGVKVYYSLAERYGVRIVERASDLWAPALKFMLALEGADVLNDVGDLKLFYRLGIRVLGITWNLDNKWGHSCYAKRDGGLTASGEELVAEAERLGVVIDLAHASRRTALDVLAMAKRPVIISHANVKAVHDHPRNVDDEVLKALADNGGVIGLTLIPSTISPSPSLNHLVKHFKYVREKFGVEVLAVGTDFLGISSAPPGLETVDKVAVLAKALVEVGFSKEEVEAVFWRNALQVFKRAL